MHIYLKFIYELILSVHLGKKNMQQFIYLVLMMPILGLVGATQWLTWTFYKWKMGKTWKSENIWHMQSCHRRSFSNYSTGREHVHMCLQIQMSKGGQKVTSMHVWCHRGMKKMWIMLFLVPKKLSNPGRNFHLIPGPGNCLVASNCFNIYKLNP